MALRSFTWTENGSPSNPVVLGASQLDSLVSALLDDSIFVDVSGYVTVEGGTIREYAKRMIEQYAPDLHVVNVRTVADTFTLISGAGNNPVAEGTRTAIKASGIDISLLDISISHNVTIDASTPAPITVRQIEDRIRYSNGYLIVDASEENAKWSDNVTITARPKYQSEASASLYIKIQAIPLTGMSISLPANMASGGEHSKITTRYSPSNHTKKVVLEYSCLNGQISDGEYYTGAAGTDTISAVASLAGEVLASATTTVNVQAPYIVVAFADDMGNPITSGVTARIQDVFGNILQRGLAPGQTYGPVVIGETYKVVAETNDTGVYYSPTAATVIPSGLATTGTVVYKCYQVGVLAVFANGTTLTYNQWNGIGRPATYKGSQLFAAAYVHPTEQKERWVTRAETFSATWAADGYQQIGADNLTVAYYKDDKGNDRAGIIRLSSNSGALTVTADQALLNTQAIKNAALKINENALGAVADPSAAKLYTSGKVAAWNVLDNYAAKCQIGGTNRKPFLPSCMQLREYGDNRNELNAILSVAKNASVTTNTISGNWWSSNEYNTSYAWYLFNGSPNYNFTKSYSETVCVFYDF